VADTSYALCLYSGSGTLLFSAGALGAEQCPSGPCWCAAGRGFQYRDKAAEADGISKLKLSKTAAGKGRLSLGAIGVPGDDHLRLPALPIQGPLTAQLQASSGQCWQTVHAVPSRNDGGGYTSSY
jgi:hypothetical protein